MGRTEEGRWSVERVLVVEDTPLDAEYVRRALRSGDDPDMVLVASAAEACELLRTDEFDVVLLDLSLPDATGVEAVVAVREVAPDQPTVVLTGNESIETTRAALAAGAQDYLVKGRFDRETLGRSLNYTMARSAADAELRKTVAELQRANAELEHYATVVSHDLRAPLRTAHSFNDLVEMLFDEDPEAAKSHLARAGASLDRMAEMIDGLLRYAHLRTAVEVRAIDIGVVLADVERLLAADLEEHGASLVYVEQGTVMGNHELLVHALLNLVGNALKYRSDAAPRVDIAVSDDGAAGMRVRVADNGIGVDPGCSDEIFELFTQIDKRASGVGAGLALTRRLLEAMGGTIECVPSEAGAIFDLTLPPAAC